MLIGVMPKAPQGQMQVVPLGYQCRVLLSRSFLPQTGQEPTLVKVLETLRVFREEWRRNQRPLVALIHRPSSDQIDTSDTFDFGRSTGLRPDVLLEIAKYLWLDDAIDAFSMSILPLLRDGYSEVHLNSPSNEYLKLIVEHLDPRQIVSVRFNGNLPPWERDFSPFRLFDRLISLTVVHGKWLCASDYLLTRFPRIRVLSLCYGAEFNFGRLLSLRSLSSGPITCLHIRCTDYISVHSSSTTQLHQHMPNPKITSFNFDSAHYEWPGENDYPPHHSSEVFTSVMEFIHSLVNVRHVRFITNRFHTETFFDIRAWQTLMRECVHLERVTIQRMDYAKFTGQVKKIEEELRQLRPGMIFRITSA